jgi:hypothetical protein
MAGPTDDIVQAREDLDRIARAFWEADDEDLRAFHRDLAAHYPIAEWEELPDDVKDHLRRTIKILIDRDVIRVGKRPVTGPEPMEGQERLVVETPDGLMDANTGEEIE